MMKQIEQGCIGTLHRDLKLYVGKCSNSLSLFIFKLERILVFITTPLHLTLTSGVYMPAFTDFTPIHIHFSPAIPTHALCNFTGFLLCAIWYFGAHQMK
jgi:hypothetical protein